MSTSGTNQESAGAGGWPSPSVLASGLAPEAVVERLRTASKRGRLPGFHEAPGGFRLEVFGIPWERELVGRVGAVGGGSEVRLTRRDKPVMPVLWAAILVLSVWPGVLLVDTFIPSSWGWLGTHVWQWYIPFTVVTNAWTWWWAVKKTNQTTAASAAEAVDRLAKALG